MQSDAVTCGVVTDAGNAPPEAETAVLAKAPKAITEWGGVGEKVA